MLTDEQKDAIGRELVPLYQQLERDVIADCVRRLQKTGRLTETAEIMADALRAKGYSPTRIRREVMRAINADAALQREIAENTRAYKQQLKADIARLNAEAGEQSGSLWEKAGNMAFREDLSLWQTDAKPVKDSAFSDMIAAMKKAAAGDLKNLTKSMGFRMSDGSLVGVRSLYTSELNRAFVKMTSGAYSWQQCVKDACRELGKSGLRTVDYDSGVTRQMDTAVFNTLRTASAQLSAQITMHNVETTGTELVEVSSHWGAREGTGHANHAGWQGKIYSVHGSTPEYPNLEEATGYPSDPRGLCGYNCRHTFYPYWEGISEPTDFPPEPAPVTVDGREYTYYQATQEQRRREREIRAMKREANALEAAGETDAAKELRAAIYGKTQEYKKFSQDVGIRAKGERLGVGEGKPLVNAFSVHDVTKEYNNVKGQNAGVVAFGNEYRKSNHEAEIRMASWIANQFGGNVLLLAESKERDKQTPDYLWNDKMWELKGVTSANSIDKNLQKAIHQISENPGGVILDCENSQLSREKIIEIAEHRMQRAQCENDVIIKYGDATYVVLRGKKKKGR